jgi:hypothetical protein
MKRHVELLEGRVGRERVKVILEGRVGKVMKGGKLLESVTFDDGDDLTVEIPKLVEEFEGGVADPEETGDDYLVEGDEGVEVVPEGFGDEPILEGEGEEVDTEEVDTFNTIDLEEECTEDPTETALQEGSTVYGARRK